MKFFSCVCYGFFFPLVSYLYDYLMVAVMNYLQVAPIFVDIFILLIKCNVAVIVTEN